MTFILSYELTFYPGFHTEFRRDVSPMTWPDDGGKISILPLLIDTNVPEHSK